MFGGFSITDSIWIRYPQIGALEPEPDISSPSSPPPTPRLWKAERLRSREQAFGFPE